MLLPSSTVDMNPERVIGESPVVGSGFMEGPAGVSSAVGPPHNLLRGMAYGLGAEFTVVALGVGVVKLILLGA